MQWKHNLYICLFGVFLSAAGLNQVAPILPIYFRELGATGTEEIAVWSGFTVGITFFVVALVTPFWGKLADRKGKKLMLLRASLGMTITNILAGLVTSPIELVAVRALQGLVSGFYSGAIALVGSQVPKERVGESLGKLSAASMAGALLGPLIGGYLADNFGIRPMFFVVSGFLALAFILIYFFVHEEAAELMPKDKQNWSFVKSKMLYPQLLWPLITISFVASVGIQALQPMMTIFVESIVGSGVEFLALISGFAFSVLGIGQMISSPYLGRLSDAKGPYIVLFWSLIYVGLMTIALDYVDTIYGVFVLRFLAGLGVGSLLPSVNTLTFKITPRAYAGQIFSYIQVGQFMGFFVGTSGGAMVFSYLGFTGFFWAVGLLLILGAFYMKRSVPDELKGIH